MTDITAMLQQHKPLTKVLNFVGDSAKTAKSEKIQLEVSITFYPKLSSLGLIEEGLFASLSLIIVIVIIIIMFYYMRNLKISHHHAVKYER